MCQGWLFADGFSGGMRRDRLQAVDAHDASCIKTHAGSQHKQPLLQPHADTCSVQT